MWQWRGPCGQKQTQGSFFRQKYFKYGQYNGRPVFLESWHNSCILEMTNLKCHCLKKESICFIAEVLQATIRPPVHSKSRIQGHQAEQQFIYRFRFSSAKQREFLPYSCFLLLPHQLQAKQLQQFTYSVFVNPFDFLCRELGEFTPTTPHAHTHCDFQQRAEICRYKQLKLPTA